MAGPNKKKTRSQNFTFDDQKRLIKLVKNHGSVIECKKTDKYSWQEKDAEWELLATEYNSGTSSAPRTATVLKAKYKNMKKEYRTYKGNMRQSQYATGGGPPGEIKPYPFQDDLSELLALSAEGLFNAHDGDRAVGQKKKHGKAEKDAGEEEERGPNSELEDMELDLGPVETELEILDIPVIISEEYVDDPENHVFERSTVKSDWRFYNIEKLQQPKHPALVLPKRARLNQGPSTSTSGNNTLDSPPCSPSTNLEGTTTKPKRIFSTNRNRPSLEKFKAQKPASTTHTKYSFLAESKKNLADLQLELVQNEIAMKKMLNEKENTLIDLKIEGQRLKNELLKKKLMHSRMTISIYNY